MRTREERAVDSGAGGDEVTRTPEVAVADEAMVCGEAGEQALFDLGLFPAAIPDPDNRVWGEVYEVLDTGSVLAALDEIEGYRPNEPERSLYTRILTGVTLDVNGGMLIH